MMKEKSDTTTTTTLLENNNEKQIENFILEIWNTIQQHNNNNNNDQTKLVIAIKNLIEQKKKKLLPSSKAIMNWLAPKLFIKKVDESEEEVHFDALQIVSLLVTIDSNTYLVPASKAVVTTVKELTTTTTTYNDNDNDNSNIDIVVSNELLQVLIQQLVYTDNLQVTTNSTQTLMILCSYYNIKKFVNNNNVHSNNNNNNNNNSKNFIIQSSIQQLVQIWEQYLNNNNNNNNISKQQASTITVRCASTICDFISTLGDDALLSSKQYNATTLLLQMLQDSSDPLVQISILDLMETLITKIISITKKQQQQNATTTTTIIQTIATRNWFMSLPVIEPILSFAGVSYSSLVTTTTTTSISSSSSTSENMDVDVDIDPLLAGSALRVLSALCGTIFSTIGNNNNDVQMQLETMHIDSQQQNNTQNTNTTNNNILLLQGFYNALHNFAKYNECNPSSVEGDRLALIYAISSFSSTSTDCLYAILNDTIICNSWLSLTNVVQPKLQAAIVLSVAMVFDPTIFLTTTTTTATNNDNDNDILHSQTTTTTTTTTNYYNNNLDLQVVSKLYTMFGQINNDNNTTKWLLSKTKSSLSELRLATYTLFIAIVKFGNTNTTNNTNNTNTNTTNNTKITNTHFIQLLLLHPGFLNDFLFNRTNENTKDGKQAKYDLIVLLYENSKGFLGNEQIRNQFELYIKQGPFFIQTMKWEIDTT